MTSRLKKRPVAGSFHGIMFIGALLLIFGHAVFTLDFIGIPVYEGWFGFIFLKLGRELGAELQTIPHSVFIDDLIGKGKLTIARRATRRSPTTTPAIWRATTTSLTRLAM